MFTEDSPIDVMKAVTRDQAIPAGCTGKTLEKKQKTELQMTLLMSFIMLLT